MPTCNRCIAQYVGLGQSCEYCGAGMCPDCYQRHGVCERSDHGICANAISADFLWTLVLRERRTVRDLRAKYEVDPDPDKERP